jgi:AbrB family looped-hinge helix DNA binding protein
MIEVGTSKVYKVGGSMRITIPLLLRTKWNIKEGDEVVFYQDRDNDSATILNPNMEEPDDQTR